GALYALLPAGLARSGRSLRTLALAAVPAAAAFLYVEQPERGLWNFHFIVIPIAMVALQELPGWAIAAFVAAAGVVGLRFGAQLDLRLAARVALLIAIGIALAASFVAVKRRDAVRSRGAEPEPGADVAPATHFWAIAAAELALFGVLAVLLIDVHA